MNKTFLIGRLTRDPDVRAIPSGVSVCTFTVAVDRRMAQGEKKADFIPVVAWRQLADLCGRYLKKGRLVAVVGSIQTRNYDAKDGTKRYVTEVLADEVQFLDRGDAQPDGEPAGNAQPIPAGLDDLDGFIDVDGTDEVPF